MDPIRPNFRPTLSAPAASRSTTAATSGRTTSPAPPPDTYVPAGPAPVPADGSLDYYRRRHDDFVRRNPGVTPPDYYLGYGDKYARRFTAELRPKLSRDGQAWLDRARVNLQTAIETERAKDPRAFEALERDPEKFRAFAYGTHAKAYLDAGLKDLPLEDLIKIGVTPDFKDLFTQAGLGQVVTVADDLAIAQIQKATGQPVAFAREILTAVSHSPGHATDVARLVARGGNAKTVTRGLVKILPFTHPLTAPLAVARVVKGFFR